MLTVEIDYFQDTRFTTPNKYIARKQSILTDSIAMESHIQKQIVKATMERAAATTRKFKQLDASGRMPKRQRDIAAKP